MKLLLDPFVNEGSFINATGRGDLLHGGPLVAAERNRHAALGAHKDGLGDLLELVSEVRHLVSVPKLSQLTN